MASLPPQDCCFKAFYHEGDYTGSYEVVAGLDTYVAGAEFGNDTIIVILTDIFGYKFNNIRLVADQLAGLNKNKVIIPDLFDGEAVVDFSNWNQQEWFGKYGPATATPKIDAYLKDIKAQFSPAKLFGIGYCFGAKFVIQHLTEDGLFTAGAIAHPSLVSVEEVEQITKPLLISTGENDSSFVPELRQKTTEILSAKKDVRWQLDIFQGAPHGFAVKGDISVPHIKYAKEKTIIDQTWWFGQF